MSFDRSKSHEDEHRESRPRRTRRVFLGQLAAVGAASIGLSSLLTACGGSDDADVAEPVAECDDYTGLSEQDLQTREALGYVADSPNPNEVCSNCRFYTQPEGDDVCGGCQLFAGPVNPGGYCNSWAAMPS